MMSGNCKCNTKNFVLSALGIFVFGFAFDWLVHGKLLTDMYMATASLWRSPEEMKAFFPWCQLPNLLIAFLIAGGYRCWRKKVTVGAVGTSECPYRKSFKFGLWLGLISGIGAASMYLVMPIPQKLAIAWLLAIAVKYAFYGALLNWFYRPDPAV